MKNLKNASVKKFSYKFISLFLIMILVGCANTQSRNTVQDFVDGASANTNQRILKQPSNTSASDPNSSDVASGFFTVLIRATIRLFSSDKD